MARLESRYSLEAAPGSGDVGAPEGDLDSTNSSPPQTSARSPQRGLASGHLHQRLGPFSARSEVGPRLPTAQGKCLWSGASGELTETLSPLEAHGEEGLERGPN